MPKQTVLFTTVPSGFLGAGGARQAILSVYVTPRLQPDPGQTLADFPDFRNWPARLLAPTTQFAVRVDNGDAIPAERVGAPSSELWQALFPTPASISVAGHAFDSLSGRDTLSGRPVITHSPARLHEHIKDAHQRLIAASPHQLPDAATTEKAMPELHEAFRPPSVPAPASTLPWNVPGGPAGAPPATAAVLTQRLNAAADHLFRPEGPSLGERIGSVLATARMLASSSPAATVTDVVPANDSKVSHFYRAVLFHYRPVADGQAAPRRPTLDEHARAIDFHQMLAALSDHPELMRRLGLIITLAVRADLIPPASADHFRRIRVDPTFAPPLGVAGAASPLLVPSTAYVLSDRFFLPAPRPVGGGQPESVLGLLNLNARRPTDPTRPAFEVVQLDVDGAALKLVQMVGAQVGRSLRQGASPAPGNTPGGEPQGTAGTDDPADRSGAPALQQAGISIVRADHARAIFAERALASGHQARFDSGQPVTLGAEDLTRGCRVDVRDMTTGEWRSLHLRSGQYTVADKLIESFGGPVANDEGLVQASVTEPARIVDAPPDPGAPLHIHESLFRWHGWSLSAPHPGNTIVQDGVVEDVTNQSVPTLPLKVTASAVNGTLPRLRFGRSYQFRLRLVDIAGGGLTPDDATAALDSLKTSGQPQPVLPDAATGFTYRRFQPVSAPVLVPREALSDGEALDRLVIRSDGGLSPEAYAEQHRAFGYTGQCERHVVPPKVSQQLAEASGMFDAAFGPGATPDSRRRAYAIALREQGRLDDGVVGRPNAGGTIQGLNADGTISRNADGTPRRLPIPDTTDSDPETGAQRTRRSVEAVTVGPNTSEYIVHHEAQLRLPYLPDPLARGAAFFGLPGTSPGTLGEVGANGTLTFTPTPLAVAGADELGSIGHLDYSTAAASWPDLAPFRLRLVGGDTQPAWNGDERVLTVAVPPGKEVVVRLSSYLPDGALDQLGLRQWLTEPAADGGQPAIPPPAAAALAPAALAGAVWALTPFHTIRLTHAVQRPKDPPSIVEMTTPARRDAGATFAYVGAKVKVHGDSTVHLDLVASWTEQVEDMEAPGGLRTLERTAQVFSKLPINLPGEPPPPDPPRRADDQEVVPISRYDRGTDTVEIVLPPVPISPPHHPHPSPPPGPHPGHPPIHPNGDDGGDNGGGETPPPPPPIALARHEFGDTKHRIVKYRAVGTSRFADAFPQAIRDDPAQVSSSSDVFTVDIPASAPPAAPRVLYAIPLFEWKIQGDPIDEKHTRVRKGNLIRVFLGRPWFSSGEGELLGVQLHSDLEDLESNVDATMWARDSIHTLAPGPGDLRDPAPPVPAPVKTVFPRALDPAPGDPSELALHGVTFAPEREFNGERGLWYSDIEMELGDSDRPDGHYRPFIRLRLVRYQRSSAVAHESAAVVTDILQLSPERTVTLVPATATSYTITVAGLTYASAARQANPAPDSTIVEVTVEQRRKGARDELAWTSAGVAAQPVGGPGAAPVLWTGTINLPDGHAPGDFRIVVKEFEQYAQDRVGDGPAGDPPFVVGRRLVFADAIVL